MVEVTTLSMIIPLVPPAAAKPALADDGSAKLVTSKL